MARKTTHVLFDLDGTLADTAPDLGAALNRVRAEEGLAPLDTAALRPAVNRGATGMIQAGFDIDNQHPQFPARRERFLHHYRNAVSGMTTLFPEIEPLLAGLEEGGYVWGVVTNKSAEFTMPLLRDLGLLDRAACVVAGDTTQYLKPHPASLLHACSLLGCEPARAVYLGDAQRDVEAGQRAGMKTLVAGYGYIPQGDAPSGWGADAVIDRPLDLLGWLRSVP